MLRISMESYLAYNQKVVIEDKAKGRYELLSFRLKGINGNLVLLYLTLEIDLSWYMIELKANTDSIDMYIFHFSGLIIG